MAADQLINFSLDHILLALSSEHEKDEIPRLVRTYVPLNYGLEKDRGDDLLIVTAAANAYFDRRLPVHSFISATRSDEIFVAMIEWLLLRKHASIFVRKVIVELINDNTPASERRLNQVQSLLKSIR